MKRGGLGTRIAIVVAIGIIFFWSRRERESSAPSPAAPDNPSPVSELDRALTPQGTPAARDGLAAAILLDVSGSMEQPPGRGGVPKIVSARRAALDLVEQFARYADDHAGEPVLLALYEFSGRAGEPDCREVIAMGAPDRARAASAIAAMRAGGGTPIGHAMVAGKRALDATGLSRRHLLVVTDGENTTGPDPAEVAVAITRRPAPEQPSVYFVAFDVSASRFNGVRDAGAFVLEAANARALNDTLNTLLREQILIER